MRERPALATALLVRLGEVANRTFVLPLLIFYATSRCNSRCVSCEWWKQNGSDDLTLDEIETVAAALPTLGTEVVAFSGGEPLLRPTVFDAARLFLRRGMRLHLMTSGILLERHVERVAEHFVHVTMSLDATTDALYQAVRGVDGLAALDRGVSRLRALCPTMPIVGRATLHRMNFRELPDLIDRARTMALDRISFLAADVSSTAFGRQQSPSASDLRLTTDEIEEFEALIEETIARYGDDFESGFIAGSPDGLRRLARYYAGLSDDVFPPVACNAPWVSVVLEANGAVRPCFFHAPVGNVREEPLAAILAGGLRDFRRRLDVTTNRLCRRCVCSIHTGWRGMPWRQ
jgi:MoaA/NifB/PqqE/SkfB family radical SAM enzyme